MLFCTLSSYFGDFAIINSAKEILENHVQKNLWD
jgi:hypothetical protein